MAVEQENRVPIKASVRPATAGFEAFPPVRQVSASMPPKHRGAAVRQFGPRSR
jgi:hypothetical protein